MTTSAPNRGIEERLVTALVPALPTAESVVAEPIADAPAVPEGAGRDRATFVGARSADIVLVIADGAALAEAAGSEATRVTPPMSCVRPSRRPPRRSAPGSSPSRARFRRRRRSSSRVARATSSVPGVGCSAGSA